MKKEPITTHPSWDEKEGNFVVGCQDKYTVDELMVLKHMGNFLKIVSKDINISVSGILDYSNYKRRDTSSDIIFAYHLLYRFVEEFFKTGTYLVQAVLNRDDITFSGFMRSQTRFARSKDPMNDISYYVLLNVFIAEYGKPNEIVLEQRTVSLSGDKKELKRCEEFRGVSQEDLLLIIFSVIKDKFDVDLHILKLGTKDKGTQYNLFVSRRISIGILVEAFGEKCDFTGLYKYLSFSGKDSSAVTSVLSYYKLEHFRDIVDNKVYKLLFKYIYVKVLREIKNKKPLK